MAAPIPFAASQPQDEREVSLLALAGVVVQWHKFIIGLAAIGAMIGLVSAQTSPQLWTSSAVFIPQGSEGGGSSGGLAFAASQFGVNVPGGGSGWGPAMYVELLRSRALLEPLGLETVVVAEDKNRSIRIVDLFKVKAPTVKRQTEITSSIISEMVEAKEEKKLGAVRISTTSRWPSVSYQLTQRLLERMNAFNIELRQSQAAVERKFVEAQSADAKMALLLAEERLRAFTQSNRQYSGSPELSLERDRLQRDVTLRQELYTSWLKSREEARIREVRNTPVITVLEDPRLPYIPESRHTVPKIIRGGFLGGLLAVVIAFLVEGLAGLRRSPGRDAQEFFQLIQDASPKFLRRRRGLA